MKHQVVYSKKSRDDLRKLSLPVARRIIEKIAFYAETKDPLEFAKPLVNCAFKKEGIGVVVAKDEVPYIGELNDRVELRMDATDRAASIVEV